jgi:hypothetical protein
MIPCCEFIDFESIFLSGPVILYEPGFGSADTGVNREIQERRAFYFSTVNKKYHLKWLSCMITSLKRKTDEPIPKNISEQIIKSGRRCRIAHLRASP